MAQTTYEKRVLMDGVGNLFLKFMETEDTSVNAPTYATEVFETPSIDQVTTSIEASDKKIYLSNVLHDDLQNITSVTLTLNAGYFPTGFAEKAQGMVDEGDGAWSMPTNPKKVPFSMAFPATDMNDDEVIYIFPKCTLAAQSADARTRREDIEEQIQTFDITGVPLVYKVTDEPRKPYFRVDLTTPEAKAIWDRQKLLTEPVYDSASLQACKDTVVVDGGA